MPGVHTLWGERLAPRLLVPAPSAYNPKPAGLVGISPEEQTAGAAARPRGLASRGLRELAGPATVRRPELRNRGPKRSRAKPE